MIESALPKLVVFDCDGTLVDSQHNVIACMNQAFISQGLSPPDEKQIRKYIGLNLEEAVRKYLPESEGEDLPLRLVANYKSAFFDRRQQPDHTEPLYHGTLELIRELDARGTCMAVATGKSMRGLNAMIEEHGLEGYFVSLQTPDHNPGKPHPQMLEKAMSDSGVGPDQTFMVGDTSFDMMLAQNAGCHAVGVSWGYHSTQELVESGANHLIDNFADLLGIVHPGKK